jgi:DNA-binding NtrC family response regulator
VLVKYSNTVVVSIILTLIFDIPKTKMPDVKNPKEPVIFIIDNSHIYKEIVKNCLEALSFRNIYTFSNCEATDTFGLVPDIVILDHELGSDGMKGIDFFRKHKSVNPHAYYIFFSSNTSIDLAVNSIRAGAFDYIVKSKAGLEHLIKRFNYLICSQVKLQKKKKILNAAIFSLGLVCLIFLTAIMLYKNQKI